MNTCPVCGTRYARSELVCTRDGSVLEEERAVDPLLGQAIDGKYQLEARLSQGGMGTVYRAMHLTLGKPVAVKVIRPDLVTSSVVARRFLQEARAASQLDHPNIARVFDLGQTLEGTLYFAMDLVDGPNLQEVIRTSSPLEPVRIVRLLRQVTSALSFAHTRNIIHRDLKPANIMVGTAADGRDQVKLLDFGIARTFELGTAQLTINRLALGTPQYISPEQATNDPVDGRSDLYALGIILYEMLAGEVPFNDPSPAAILVKQIREAPMPPSQRRPDLNIPRALEAIALRCLEKDAGKRFQTAGELDRTLELPGDQ
jgi:eukaryotic-like serine/threonine-protein kinase